MIKIKLPTISNELVENIKTTYAREFKRFRENYPLTNEERINAPRNVYQYLFKEYIYSKEMIVVQAYLTARKPQKGRHGSITSCKRTARLYNVLKAFLGDSTVRAKTKLDTTELETFCKAYERLRNKQDDDE